VTDPSLLTPANFLMPASSVEPLVIHVRSEALTMAVVNRDSVANLDAEWDKIGVYVLLWPIAADGSYTAYVGKVGQSTLRKRLYQHDRSKEGWTRALLVRRDTSDGFNSAETGWLEGRITDVLALAPLATPINRPDKDESLPQYEREALDRAIRPIAAVMRVLGASPDTPDQAPPVKTRRRPRTYSETLSDLIEGGFLHVGARLRSLYTGTDAAATVVDGGKLEVSGTVFDTPSGAAVHLRGRETNGWDFWGAPSGDGSLIALSELRRRLREEGARESHRTVGSPNLNDESTRSRPTPNAVSLADLIAADLLAADAELVASSRGAQHVARLSGSEIDLNGRCYPSLSAAAVAITGKPTNGWSFWRVEHDGKSVPLAKLRAALQPAAVEPAAAEPAVTIEE
jgi:hypothetical protein